jgi:class 3 adenylate cyclase
VSSLPSGTVTFLFTDIEGSTALLRQLGDGYADVLRQERAILREKLGAAGGSEIDTQGDAFFFSFPRARDAVAGAVAAQRALADHEWPDGAEVKVRMGLHTGEPAVGEDGYVGLDVVRAARICSAGHGGQILLSETTRALLGNELPERVSIRDLGEQRLKDVQHERVFELSLDESPAAFPPLKQEARGDTMEDRFAQRINQYVEEQLEAAFSGPLPTAGRRRVRRGCLLTLVVLAAAVAALVFVAPLLF